MLVTLSNGSSHRENAMKSALQPSRDFLSAHGLVVEPEELQAMVRHAIVQLQESLYPPEPEADFTAAEAEALARGGLDLSPRSDEEESPIPRDVDRAGDRLSPS